MPLMKNAHSAGSTDRPYAQGTKPPVARVAKPHNTPDMNDKITTP
jgi:hypothetical protein